MRAGFPPNSPSLAQLAASHIRVLSPTDACRAFTKFGNHLLKGFANAKAKSLLGRRSIRATKAAAYAKATRRVNTCEDSVFGRKPSFL